jgi:hypothetical protein
MSKSPLSGAFADSSATTKKKSKKNGAILLIAGIALTSSIGGVFAANSSIEINGGDALEFGQGLAGVDVCSSTATTSITQTFDETASSGDGEFYVGSVTLTIPDANETACEGKEATVTLVVDDGVNAVTTATVDAETIADGAASFDFSASSIVAGHVTDIAVSTAD